MFLVNDIGDALRKRSEHLLVRLAQEGDDEAFNELMSRSWDICMRVAACTLGNREDAIDEVQDAFWKAYTHIRTFNQQSKFSTWVARIVINHCLMQLRQRKRQRFVSCETVTSSGEEYVAHEAVNAETPEDLLGSTQLREVLNCELGRIPALLRLPLQLRYIQGLSLEEVAQHLDISVGATKSRLHRAQSYLKNRMLRHCGARGVGTLTRVA